MTNFKTFYTLFRNKGCFSVKEVYDVFKTFDKNNLTRWCQQRQLIKVRNGYYLFPEFLQDKRFLYFVANCIYPASYVSLHSALIAANFLLPTSYSHINSVSQYKTTCFNNWIGKFSYQKIQNHLHFGIEKIDAQFPYLIAQPEKALLDLFYLNAPYFSTESSIRAIALNLETLYYYFDIHRFQTYLHRFENKALEQRATLFLQIYGLS